MDLDSVKTLDTPGSRCARIGMLFFFALAAGILIYSIWMPSTARAIGFETHLHSTR